MLLCLQVCTYIHFSSNIIEMFHVLYIYFTFFTVLSSWLKQFMLARFQSTKTFPQVRIISPRQCRIVWKLSVLSRAEA